MSVPAKNSVIEFPLSLALRYAALGWHVLPILPGTKKPAISGWQTEASTDPRKIRAWLQEFPRANIAVHCGLSGLVVVDVDNRNGGDKTLATLERKHGCYLWDSGCLIADTPGGGQHYVARMPAGVRMGSSLGDGLDLLHLNHYFLVASSVGANGRGYEWLRGCSPFEVSDIPELPRAFWGTTGAEVASQLDPADALLLRGPRPLENSEAERERLLSAIVQLDPNCEYPEWRDIVFGILASGLPDAPDIARQWSEGAASRFEERAFTTLLKSYRDERRAGAELITVASVFHKAKALGWVDPRTANGSEKDHHGDLDNGQRFANRYRGQFLYVHGESTWLQWDNSRWVRCERGTEGSRPNHRERGARCGPVRTTQGLDRQGPRQLPSSPVGLSQCKAS